MSSETITAATTALGIRRLRHHPTTASSSFVSFRFRPTARLPGAVTASASASSRLCKAKAHQDDAKASSADQLVLDVAESTWDDLVLGCESPVLVEFWAPWCGPCRLMHTVIADVAKTYAGKLRCLKLNTDENHDLATWYGIRSIPTILIFKNGERKETVIGAVSDTTLATTVERFL
ncbi:hypothetical protein HU200_039686 [Digitaria exilis]|uniref:Thioredoxin domain-containing protein n=1 Tax=Digitaria exilis TaxID=1010633 RepID=A0A835B7P1_9POAL|nr:hypothetical protein HU200_039686 [Digitaria exilis]CAB3469138.1 unnamed protein product [Digitaria exilis]